MAIERSRRGLLLRLLLELEDVKKKQKKKEDAKERKELFEMHSEGVTLSFSLLLLWLKGLESEAHEWIEEHSPRVYRQPKELEQKTENREKKTTMREEKENRRSPAVSLVLRAAESLYVYKGRSQQESRKQTHLAIHSQPCIFIQTEIDRKPPTFLLLLLLPPDLTYSLTEQIAESLFHISISLSISPSDEGVSSRLIYIKRETTQGRSRYLFVPMHAHEHFDEESQQQQQHGTKALLELPSRRPSFLPLRKSDRQ